MKKSLAKECCEAAKKEFLDSLPSAVRIRELELALQECKQALDWYYDQEEEGLYE